jgi:pimeloyl-ACP methyl ester carboxylesterase
MIREKVITVGESPALVGIVCEPASGVDPACPALIVLNSGLLPRVGPGRSSVVATRRAAERGLLGVRFDLSGVGDSDPRRDVASFEDRWIDDTRAMLDRLQSTRGIERFVLMGLCSGADTSFQLAVRDERVAGLVLLDGYAYRTPEFLARRYGEKVLDPASVGRLAKRTFTGLLKRVVDGRRVSEPPPSGAPASTPPPSLAPASTPPPPLTEDDLEVSIPPGPQPQYVREFPPKAQVASQLRVMVARGVQLCIIHSGAMDLYYNYADQFRDAFRDVPFGDALALHYFADADHTFTELSQQRAMQQAVEDFLKRFTRSKEKSP